MHWFSHHGITSYLLSNLDSTYLYEEHEKDGDASAADDDPAEDDGDGGVADGSHADAPDGVNDGQVTVEGQ